MVELGNSPDNKMNIELSYRGQKEIFSLDNAATINDLSQAIFERLSIPPGNQKLTVPKHGLLQAPFSTTQPASTLLQHQQSGQPSKITLFGASTSAVSKVKHAASVAARRNANHALALRTSSSQKSFPSSLLSSINTLSSSDNRSVHGFMTIRALPHLPNAAASHAYLERLASDPGVRHAMRKHGFSVGLLTELDPWAGGGRYTRATYEGGGGGMGVERTLGLNRNRGEVIELRLRTDRGDGLRHYATVRRTLCHELAHNVYSEHDAHFWRLCKEIERDVEGFEATGRSVGDTASDVAPPRWDSAHHDSGTVDHGGWTGGEFVLGSDSDMDQSATLSRREILARAAEERQRRLKEDRQNP